MQNKNEFLATTPFDLYELHLFHLVAKAQSFTRAAEIAGLTQSAVTRQIQGMEGSLGLALFERTTRKVRLTEAGDFLFQESSRLVGDVERTATRLREDFGAARKQVRIGVSRSIGFAYLPGFLHANLRRAPEVACIVSHQSSGGIRAALEANELDIGVFCAPRRLARSLSVIHEFEDAFTLIASRESADSWPQTGAARRRQWLDRQTWLCLDENAETGMQLAQWIEQQGLRMEAAMRSDSFDLIINLVAAGLGVSFVPIRALALYGGRRQIVRLRLPERFVRRLVVATRRQRKMPAHLDRFVENILF